MLSLLSPLVLAFRFWKLRPKSNRYPGQDQNNRGWPRNGVADFHNENVVVMHYLSSAHYRLQITITVRGSVVKVRS